MGGGGRRGERRLCVWRETWENGIPCRERVDTRHWVIYRTELARAMTRFSNSLSCPSRALPGKKERVRGHGEEGESERETCERRRKKGSMVMMCCWRLKALRTKAQTPRRVRGEVPTYLYEVRGPGEPVAVGDDRISSSQSMQSPSIDRGTSAFAPQPLIISSTTAQ